MKQFIHVNKEIRQSLAKAFSIGERTVFNALNFDPERGNTDLSARIRKLALAKGGILMNESPAMETLHDESDGYIRQYFPNGAMLEISKKDDATAALYYKGDVVKRYTGVTLNHINNMQGDAMALGRRQ